MAITSSRARERVLIAVLGLVSCLPVPVPLDVRNRTPETIEVRIAGSRGGWATIESGATNSVGGFNYQGWCNVPDRWLPEDFEGLEVRLPDGSRQDVTTAQFVADAAYDRGWTYPFTRSDPDGRARLY